MGDSIVFRPLTAGDLPALHEWLSRPHVAEWWSRPTTLSGVEADYGPAIAASVPLECFFALAEGTEIGFIQSYVPAGCHEDGWWPYEDDPGVRGIDQFLANEEQLGHGLGTALVRAFVERLFADPAVTRIQTDPAPDNLRAIRCYEKAGFRAAGEIVTPDGPALLMYCGRPGRSTN